LKDVNAFKQGLESAGVPHQISIYEGQPHAFVHGAEAIKAGGAQGEAWNEMLEFLDANLKQLSFRNVSDEDSAYLAPFDIAYYLRLVFEHAFGSAYHTH
jgi:hypothetical protein